MARNDSVETGSVGNQSIGLGNFLGVPKSDSPGLLTVPTGHGNGNYRLILRRQLMHNTAMAHLTYLTLANFNLC